MWFERQTQAQARQCLGVLVYLCACVCSCIPQGSKGDPGLPGLPGPAGLLGQKGDRVLHLHKTRIYTFYFAIVPCKPNYKVYVFLLLNLQGNVGLTGPKGEQVGHIFPNMQTQKWLIQISQIIQLIYYVFVQGPPGEEGTPGEKGDVVCKT